MHQFIDPTVARIILHEWHKLGCPTDLWPITLYADNGRRAVEIADVDHLRLMTEGTRVVERVVELND